MSFKLRFLISLLGWMCVVGIVLSALPARAAQPPLSACDPIGTPHYEYKTVGRHIVFACKNPTGTAVYPHGIYCSHDVCDPDKFAATVVRVVIASDFKKAIDDEWAAAIKWSCDAPPDAKAESLCAEHRKYVSDNWSTWTKEFKPAVWKVKPNGTYTTRPAQTLTNGVLSDSKVRATIGTVCDLSKPTHPATNGDIKAEFGTSGVVAICARTK